ncbi:beta-glucosidase 12-like [Prunus yedoensis var. nudiflora]|uniref:Beta-glucosidase 12-like n=1 Tax=Prunus yedoensis var. nudiflora TaxID=2094558 RepID=A0A314ZTS8_PRUYE|nr:beta-glucosidase 12-like [Prunus yedoensis var. nudiflora]
MGLQEKYNNPLISITENDVDELNDTSLSLAQALNDTNRIDYYHNHIYDDKAAIKKGIKLKGYFAWSLLDNFEWNFEYTVRLVSTTWITTMNLKGT